MNNYQRGLSKALCVWKWDHTQNGSWWGMWFCLTTLVWVYRIPSGYVEIAIENGPVEIVDLLIENGDFP